MEGSTNCAMKVDPGRQGSVKQNLMLSDCS
jgi:hypothetical protein